MRQIGKVWSPIGLALIMSLGLSFLTSSVALAQTGIPLDSTSTPLPDSPPVAGSPEEKVIPWIRPRIVTTHTFPYMYAQVMADNVSVYQDPAHLGQGIAPIRSLGSGYLWVTLENSTAIEVDGQEWYEINPNEYVPADQLRIYPPSQFQGMKMTQSRKFAWVVFDTWSSSAPGEPPTEDSTLIKRYSRVPIYEEKLLKDQLVTIYEDEDKIEDRTWYRIGKDQWVEQGMVGIVEPQPRPEGVGPEDKWIEVDLYEQTLMAYEGDRMVYATLISSGLPWWETETGLFQIWVKIENSKMSGREGYSDYYFLENVLYSMYFNHDYALHGAYWHDRFGRKHSHGCVNMSLKDAAWLFEWTTPVAEENWTLSTEEDTGTWVWVHE